MHPQTLPRRELGAKTPTPAFHAGYGNKKNVKKGGGWVAVFISTDYMD